MDIEVLTSIASTPGSGRNCYVIGVHDKMYHSDDTVATAILYLLHQNEKIIVVRSKDIDKLNMCDIIVDIGGGEFDHHMPGFNLKRTNGITYASAGLVWQKFGKQVIINFLEELGLLEELEELSSNIAETVDTDIIQYVDAEDNGIEMGTHCMSFISSYLPAWYESSPDFDNSFYKVLKTTIDVLTHKITKIIEETYADKIINKLIQDKRYLSNFILEIPSQTTPWLKPICSINKEDLIVAFVIFPYPNGGWAAQCVPPSLEEKFDQIAPFPSAWAGETERLPEISGVNDAIRCHNMLFFARAKSKAGIIQMCKIAMQ